jgi:tRNA modification GTPase
MRDLLDTIAAVATPSGTGGISVVRISGDQAHQAALGLMGNQSLGHHGKLVRRVLLDPTSGEPLDEGMVVRFDAPRSYTGEDVAELHVHGSPLLCQRIIELLVRQGVRPARAGEFTLRAYLNGRRTLNEAEAVPEVFAARSLTSLTQAVRRLTGELHRPLDALESKLLSLVARVEADLDFPEDVPQERWPELHRAIEDCAKACRRLLEGIWRARSLRTGYRVALAGPPNAGKSSLFNALLGRNRSIVTPEAGTTRDYIEEMLPETRMPIVLVDTAGLRPSIGIAEEEGIARSHSQIEAAHLVLVLRDARLAATDGRPPELPGLPSQCIRFVATHADVAGTEDTASTEFLVSSITGQGVDELRQELVALADRELGCDDTSPTLSGPRQEHHVRKALEALETALADGEDLPEDILASLLRESLTHLRWISGRGDVSEEILEEIFSRFCIGK